jgi:hypothetical protein
MIFKEEPPAFKHWSIAIASASVAERFPSATPITEPVPLAATAIAP